MRLDFTILWIDDQQNHIRSFEEPLRKEVDKLGFSLQVKAAANLEQVSQFVGEHVHDDAIDLVLVDYDLTGHGSGGEKALSQVRKKLPFKEIVFYSAADPKDLRQIAFKEGVDGVYFASRLGLVNAATKVIRELLRKVMDLDHMRGVVMSAASDIDYMVERSLVALHSSLDATAQAAFREQLVLEIRKKLSNWSEDLDRAVKKNTLESLVKVRHLYSASDKLQSLLTQLASWEEDHGERLVKVRAYIDEVVQRRNKLAHAMLKSQDGKMVMVGMEEPWTADDMTSLRRELVDHRENFTAIAVMLDVKLD